MRHIYFILAFLTLSTISNVKADEYLQTPYYISAGANFNFLKSHFSHSEKYHTGVSTNVAGGRWFTNLIRGEIELSYKHNNRRIRTNDKNYNLKSTDAFSAMCNGYLEMDISMSFIPYVGAGLGSSIRKTHYVSRSSQFYSPRLTSQFIGGLKFDLDPYLDLSVEYRSIHTNMSLHEQSLGILVTYKL